ncbi:MAG: DNA methyltransferase [Candidatus Magasanikiibacteriota bacterium]
MKINLVKQFSNFKPDKDWSFKEVSRAETTAFTHSYHRYPAKFIPNIVEKLLEDFTSKRDTILDPFGGCGTTMVECKRLGRKSIGFDINPVAKFIAEVKVTAIDPIILDIGFEKLKSKIFNKKIVTLKNHLKNDRLLYWFDKKTIKKLDYIYSEIRKIKDEEIRKFFLCSFSHNLKNSSRWLMKSIKPTVDKNKNTPSVYETFLKHTKSMVKKNKEFYEELLKNQNLKVPTKVLLHDSTKKFPIGKNKVDLIITSPPYVTSYEYADLHQLSLLWFGGDKKIFNDWHKHSNNFNEFRKKFIGTSFKNKQAGNLESEIGEKIINSLHVINKTLSKDVANYFIDMKSAFKEMYRVLKVGKYACVVIGNTQLRGIDILNAEVASEQMINIGFKIYRIIKRKVINKMITPWRDISTGKFTNKNNKNKKCAYEYEYILIMKK